MAGVGDGDGEKNSEVTGVENSELFCTGSGRGSTAGAGATGANADLAGEDTPGNADIPNVVPKGLSLGVRLEKAAIFGGSTAG